MTESSISAYDEFSTKSAEQYLQTVVLIDDRIYESKSGSVVSRLKAPPTMQRKSALKTIAPTLSQGRKDDEQDETPEKPGEVSFQDVQNSFAKKRIICALYQPKKNASFGEQSEVYNLCSAADVVIVDWDLDGDDGKNATILVGTLVEQSQMEIPQQLRLILIYTLEVNLRSVADKIFEDLVKRLADDKVDADPQSEGLVITTDNARVVILGKRPNPSFLQYSNFIVPEKDLAERTITEFSQLASGLLQGIVLRGFAKLRENNRRILTRFRKELDIAFLTHRALLLPNESFGQIIPLLTNELHAVLDDTLGVSPLGTGATTEKILNDWCDKHWKKSPNTKLKIGIGADGLEFVRDVFCNGPAIKKDYSGVRDSQIPGLIDKGDKAPPKWREKGYDKLTEYLLGDSGAEHSNEMLGALMSQREIYGDAQKALHLGVIIREVVNNKRFLLCLQPVCDSVRMGGKPRTFVFSILNETKVGDRLTHCVIDMSGNVIRLEYKPQVTSVYVSEFESKTDTVLANLDKSSRFIFKDKKNIEYEWIAELKTEHAQRAAEQFGRDISRVGLTESEWLRIKAK